MAAPNNPQAIFIETKDAAIILNRSISTVRRLFKNIRVAYAKPQDSRIQVEEFCAYMDIKPETYYTAISGKK